MSPSVDPFFIEFEDMLKSIEMTVIRFFRENPMLTDHQIDKVYEAFQRSYEHQLKGKNPPPLRLKDLEVPLYDRLLPVTEAWLRDGDYTNDRGLRLSVGAPVSKENMVTAYKRLRRSIKIWTGNIRGRRGYLDYIGEFL